MLFGLELLLRLIVAFDLAPILAMYVRKPAMLEQIAFWVRPVLSLAAATSLVAFQYVSRIILLMLLLYMTRSHIFSFARRLK